MSASLGDDSDEETSEEVPRAADTPAISAPTVLVADGPNRADRYASWIDSPFPVETANSPAGASELISPKIGVAVLGAGVSDDSKQQLLDSLGVRNPFARSILVQGDDEPPMLEGAGYDICLFTPLEEDDLREAVSRLARIATYERAVSAFFEYTTHAANMQVGKSETALSEDETYQDIQERIDQTKAALERIRTSMDETDRRILMESLEADPGAGFASEDAGAGGGRHPDKCSDCGLEWGTSHGGGLANGYEQLGAFVWKCTRCGSVQQAANASHRWLARR
ncbi:HalX domain-containing protein [Salinarchaeum laminariae]|uniref:HalX domain-containing protein n=1 Tax=Salinarchaeum laminariae TaxID=869888 RepID=UPI0020BF6DEB|nr:HalX domain-containing protein [Salinarchaeum laminariae]